MAAKIITFEGIDGSGKSTLVQTLREHFTAKGLRVRSTSEPWEPWKVLAPLNPDPFIATLQLMIDRRRHCATMQGDPAFDLILIDRFDLSTEAYQGYGDDISVHLIQQLNILATQGINVTRRIFLDVPINIAVERIMARGEELTVDDVVRMERVRTGYAHMADMRRMQAIDATQSPDRVLADAIRLIDEVLETERSQNG